MPVHVVLSPHLDDAVLSCGGLLAVLARSGTVLVATVFSASSPPPHTRAARSFLRQCSAADAGDLFAARRAEDAQVVESLGAEPVHLGLADALFRRARGGTALARVLPELGACYPTYRLDIARGRLSRRDPVTAPVLAGLLAGALPLSEASTVLAPVGVGRHVDHLLVRRAAELLPREVTYYRDQPYDFRGAPAPPPPPGARWEFPAPASKPALVRGYRTQVLALFGEQGVPPLPEAFYGPRPAGAAVSQD